MIWKTALILWVIVGFWGCTRQTEQRAVDLTVPVTVKPVEVGTIEDVVSTTGTLRSVRVANLVTEIRGNLSFSEMAGRSLKNGIRVKKGQVVARVDNPEWVIGVRLESKKLARDTAQKTLKEQEVLFSKGLTTEKEVENARKAWQDAVSSYEDAEIQKAKTEIMAPIDGVLSEVSEITQGTLVNQNVVIGKVVDYSQVLVDLKIPNAQIGKIALGKEVRIFNFAFPDVIFKGEVSAIDPVLDENTRTFLAIGTVDNPDLSLRPGMFVKADIVSETHQDVVLISRKLLQRRRNEQVVFVEEEGLSQQREVKTGLENRERVEIISGLEPGDRMITSNYETLRPRTRVRITGQDN